jgi:1-acyl-sn-glycerol-3-phosphate acyltransferase
MVDGLSARGGWPALVTLGEEGVEICKWTSAAFGSPLTRLVSRLAQALPIDPGRAGLSSLAFGRGLNLVWFAFGERSPTGCQQSFEPGMGVLLSYYPVPVVPAFIRGTYGSMPRGKSFSGSSRSPSVNRSIPLAWMVLPGPGSES